MLRRLVVVLSLLATLPLLAATQGGTVPVPLPLFPGNNWWNTDVTLAPVDSNSANFITFLGGVNRSLHPDFGGDYSDVNCPVNCVYGIPFIIVDGSQAKKTVTFVYQTESDGVDHATETSFPFYPVPDEAITLKGWVEGGPPGNVNMAGDRHILVVDRTNNTLYELFSAWHNGTNWQAGSGAFFDMNTNNRRPDTWTSADAAGLAIFPGLVRYDEVFGSDEIRHAFRVTVQASNGYVFPASHSAGSNSSALPMGARLRLKASKDISTFTPEMQKIFRAFKKYGLIVADNGSNMYISGTYDTRWNNDTLNPAFRALKASDFEVVQRGWAPTRSYILTMASVAGANNPTSVTITVYDASYNVATGYTGTVRFTSTDGSATLPFDYTFTVADAGTHTFTNGVTLQNAGSQAVTATDMGDGTINGTKGITVGPGTPTALTATGVSATQVNLTWSASATQYEVFRKSASADYTSIAITAATNYSDSSLAPGAAFAYKVRALDASARLSPLSAPDVATTVVFTDPSITAGVTLVKLIHMSELRQAAAALRTTAGSGVFAFTDPVLATSTLIKADHIQELRTAVAQARATLGVSTFVFTDPTLTVGATTVRGTHVQDLRNGVQ